MAAGAIIWHRGHRSQRAQIGMVVLALGTVFLPLLSGLVIVTIALFLTGLALAPTLIALFSLIEASVPRSRLNEAMGFVQTGMSAGIAPGAWLAGVVADEHGGSAAYWVCTVSAVLAVLAGVAVRRPAPRAVGVRAPSVGLTCATWRRGPTGRAWPRLIRPRSSARTTPARSRRRWSPHATST